MNKKEKEAIERLDRKLTSEIFTKNIGMPVHIEDVEIVLNLIQKQDKIIDKMGSHIFYHQDDKFPIGYSIKEVKEYFKKVVDEDAKD